MNFLFWGPDLLWGVTGRTVSYRECIKHEDRTWLLYFDFLQVFGQKQRLIYHGRICRKSPQRQTHTSIWMFPKIAGFPPKSSILIGFSIIFTIHFWGIPIFGFPPISYPSFNGGGAVWQSCSLPQGLNKYKAPTNTIRCDCWINLGPLKGVKKTPVKAITPLIR